MVNDIRRFLLGGLLVALAIGFAGSTTALPALQLGPGSTGDWVYLPGDVVDEDTWVTGDSPAELLALANATQDMGGQGA
jgi:hypothetical protein